MTRLFEAFKRYHNVNYHDGDDTFDDEVYKKSNGEDFDNPFVQECFDHFEAGWDVQQKLIIEALFLISEYEYGVLDFPMQKIKKALIGDFDEMSREKFEEWYEKNNDFMINTQFVMEGNYYLDRHVRMAWLAWQEQQKAVDEIESKITDLSKNLKDREMAVLVRQEIIDSALTVLKSLKSENDLWRCDQVSVQIDLLENTLRGEL